MPIGNEIIFVQAAKKRDKGHLEDKEFGEPQPAGIKRVTSSTAEAKTGERRKMSRPRRNGQRFSPRKSQMQQNWLQEDLLRLQASRRWSLLCKASQKKKTKPQLEALLTETLSYHKVKPTLKF